MIQTYQEKADALHEAIRVLHEERAEIEERKVYISNAIDILGTEMSHFVEKQRLINQQMKEDQK